MTRTRLLTLALLLTCGLTCSPAFAQRPADPALLVPQNAPELEFTAVANPLTIPQGMNMGAPASLTFDKQGHLWILYRGEQPFVEFDGEGKFIRAFGDNLFVRSHGLRFDADGNI